MADQRIRTRFALGLLLFLTAGCGRNSFSFAQMPVTAHGAAVDSQHLSAAGRQLLLAYLESAELPDLRWPKFENYRKEVGEFYDSCAGELAWVRGGRPTQQARDDSRYWVTSRTDSGRALRRKENTRARSSRR